MTIPRPGSPKTCASPAPTCPIPKSPPPSPRTRATPTTGCAATASAPTWRPGARVRKLSACPSAATRAAVRWATATAGSRSATPHGAPWCTDGGSTIWRTPGSSMSRSPARTARGGSSAGSSITPPRAASSPCARPPSSSRRAASARSISRRPTRCAAIPAIPTRWRCGRAPNWWTWNRCSSCPSA